jgi:hypothetical protein
VRTWVQTPVLKRKKKVKGSKKIHRNAEIESKQK